MIRIAGKATLIVAAMIAVGVSAAWTRSTGSREPHLMKVAPMVFVETKATGERIEHQGLQAHIQIPLSASEADLPPFAQDLFDRSLRAEAQASGKSSVWLTFYFADTPTDLQGKVKTFRIIFVREGAGWRKVTRDVAQGA